MIHEMIQLMKSVTTPNQIIDIDNRLSTLLADNPSWQHIVHLARDNDCIPTSDELKNIGLDTDNADILSYATASEAFILAVKRTLTSAAMASILGQGMSNFNGNDTLDLLTEALSNLRSADNEDIFNVTTVSELMQVEPPKWLIKDLVHEHETALIHSIPKVGKTTILLIMIKNWLESHPDKHVLYLTEEGEGTLKASQHRVGLDESHNITFVQFARNTHVSSFPEAIKAYDKDVDLVVVDTIGPFAGVEDLNDASPIEKMIYEWNAVRDELGCTVILSSHSRKEHGGPLTSHLGSVKWVAAVDSIIHMTQPKEESNVRTIKTFGRYENSTQKIEVDTASVPWTIEEPNIMNETDEEILDWIDAGYDTGAKMMTQTDKSKQYLYKRLKHLKQLGMISATSIDGVTHYKAKL